MEEVVAPVGALALVGAVLAAVYWMWRRLARGTPVPLTWGRDGLVKSVGRPPEFARDGAAVAPGPAGASLRLQWTALIVTALAHAEGRFAQLAVPVRDGVALAQVRLWTRLGYAVRVGRSLTAECVTLTLWPDPARVAVPPDVARQLVLTVDAACRAGEDLTAPEVADLAPDLLPARVERAGE